MYCDAHKAEGMKDFLGDFPHDNDNGKDVKAEEGKQNYYDVLGVKKDASPTDIRHTYHKLALECHPDKYPGDSEKEARFRDISEAYAVLSDPEKRNVYDRSGDEGVASSEAFQGSFPEGFTVVNAKEVFRKQFNDPDTGVVDDQTFFYEFLKTNTITVSVRIIGPKIAACICHLFFHFLYTYAYHPLMCVISNHLSLSGILS